MEFAASMHGIHEEKLCDEDEKRLIHVHKKSLNAYITNAIVCGTFYT